MTNSPAFCIGYIVLIFAFMYFIAIRPQQKEKKKMQEPVSYTHLTLPTNSLV